MLEEQLVLVQSERDDLQRDVKDSTSAFSSSYVMSERLMTAERELYGVRAQLAQASAERSSLQENAMELRSAKADQDRELQEAVNRCDHMDKVRGPAGTCQLRLLTHQARVEHN